MYLTYSESPTQKQPIIAEVQRILNYIRPNVSIISSYQWTNLAVDGMFGPKTRDAISAFQDIYKLRPPVYGILGDTTYNLIKQKECEIRDKMSRQTILTNVSIPPQTKPPLAAWEKWDAVGETAGWTSLMIDEKSPITKALIESLPKIWQRMKSYNGKPAFVFSYPRGDLYKRINMGETISHHLAVFGFVVQVFTIGPKIDEFRKNWATGEYRTRTKAFVDMGSSIMQLILGTPEAIVRLKTLMNSNRFLITGAGTVQTGTIAALSRWCNYIGAFMIGWTIGEFIGSRKLPNGKTVQDYIDKYIDKAWDHPYETLGKLGPTGLAMATGLVAWQKGIELWVNRVKVLKPLTPEEQKKMDQYLKEHPDVVFKRL